MKNFFIHFLLLCGLFLRPAFAYGPRAVAEEMSFWFLYQLEGAVADEGSTDYRPMVATACAAPGERCGLKEFLKYLWAPQVDANGNPKPGLPPWEKPVKQDPLKKFGLAFDWTTADMSQLFDSIRAAKYTDGVVGSKLLQGATTYWEARREVTGAIPTIESLYPDIDNPSAAYSKVQQLIAKSKTANDIAYKVRLMDFEDYRINRGVLRKILGGMELKTKQVLTGIKNPASFQALDAAGTEALHTDVPGFPDQLQAGCETFAENDPNHWNALQQARLALQNGHCEVPTDVLL